VRNVAEGFLLALCGGPVLSMQVGRCLSAGLAEGVEALLCVEAKQFKGVVYMIGSLCN
jgi:hypothetical protein